ncbi:aminotransferase class V-fold PLP-dependent enzyme [Salinicola corii]|uniref:Aminotransferase class V-fold PLP-dependent enzyme n=1 Tax=Salinicola corii TaxID=2606937 RepID=A0A640W8S0_9GAMM|nr:aminotransferase class V-fold PLP-dependent enzyme [Salinicola corii]KAA0015080.1 aminotransferase class V-fold PLP-dependent enzyme [Salinicola corii]
MTQTESSIFDRVRREFRILDELTYLDVAGRAPMADRVYRELVQYLEVCRGRAADKNEWLSRVEGLRDRTARFIGAEANEIAFMKNTSDGLNTVGWALGLEAGDSVLVSPEFEHANNVYPWVNMQDRGVIIRKISSPSGSTISAEDVASSIDETTKLVTLSAVSSWTGARPNLAAIADVCHKHDVFFLVDAAQALGVVDIDVHRDKIDALAGATQKGLLGMYGLGILYCRAKWIDRLRPPFLSVAGVDRGSLHESELGDFESVSLLDSAARFEVGNPNFAGLLGFDASLSLLEEVGGRGIERFVIDLADQLRVELSEIGIRPVLQQAESGIVSFDVPNPEQLIANLEANNVRVSLRRGRVRVSLHIYNNRYDIDRLINLLRKFR